jgi:hypothetical protein
VNIATLADVRPQAPFAVDQTLAWRKPGVAATRQAFLLPPDRPMPG